MGLISAFTLHEVSKALLCKSIQNGTESHGVQHYCNERAENRPAAYLGMSSQLCRYNNTSWKQKLLSISWRCGKSRTYLYTDPLDYELLLMSLVRGLCQLDASHVPVPCWHWNVGVCPFSAAYTSLISISI